MQVHEIENAPRENISHCENEWMANQFAILRTYFCKKIFEYFQVNSLLLELEVRV